MIVEIVLIVVGLAVVLWGADRFTDGACGMARRLKVSELVVGLTVVSLGTSLPEFMVSFMSLLRHSSNMSVGNVMGSNIFNILVIIGVSAILCDIKVKNSLLWRDLPICFVVSALLLVFAVSGGRIERWEGMALATYFFCYLYMAYRIALSDRKAAADEEPKGEQMSVVRMVVLIVVGIASLIVGGNVLVDNAAAVAREWGISESVIGMTILAGGTSFPELATSVVAASKGRYGLALGNVFGSNIFNIAFVIGFCSSVVPMEVTQIRTADWAMLVGSCVLVWLTAFTRRTFNRWEGILLTLSYVTYITWLIVGK